MQDRKNNLKKVYIAGQVTGQPWKDVIETFAAAETYLYELGYGCVINPTKTSAEEIDWNTAMKKCIKQLMDCDVIYMLPDWTKSRGAILERYIASNLGIEIIEGGVL